MDALPELGTLSDADLKQLLKELGEQENRLSYERRLLHGKIDILKAELTLRLKNKGESEILRQVDVDRLTEILSGKSTPAAE